MLVTWFFSSDTAGLVQAAWFTCKERVNPVTSTVCCYPRDLGNISGECLGV